MKKSRLFIVIALLGSSLAILSYCKKSDSFNEINGTPVVTTRAIVDTSWTFDAVHSNVGWQSKFYDYSSTMLTGRFNNYNFSPKFWFDDSVLSNCWIHGWVQLSTNNTGQPGRDGLGGCGPTYVGITYLDSAAKVKVDPQSDTAWYNGTSVVRSGSGYIVNGTMTFNRYRPASGNPDKQRITKPCTMYLTYNGMKDFPNATGGGGTYRAGFTGTFSFNRSDYMDVNATKAYNWANPTDPATQNNKTYGVYSTSVGDQMDITINLEFNKKHK